ncbi:MAG: signal peptidase I [Eubacterium sp.]|nr:signal peptidase I [Eubacterium sp.]
MRLPLRRGLNFHRRRRKVEVNTVKSSVMFAIQIVIVIVVAFVCVYFFGMKATVIGNSMSVTLEDGDKVLVNRFVYALKGPKANDIIVFFPNGNENTHYYVKRVVAVPGDTVQIKSGELYVNGELFFEDANQNIEYAGLAEEIVTVGEDEYFVIGDNPNSSEDSRYANIGNIKKEYIEGKAWFRTGPGSPRGRIK